MYNRYIRNDSGIYTRIPLDDTQQAAPPPPSHGQHQKAGASPPPPSGAVDGLTAFLRQILDQLHLERVDTGDLILLVLLFLLFREEAALLNGAENAEQVYLEKILPAKMKYNLDDLLAFSLRRDIRVLFQTLHAVFFK